MAQGFFPASEKRVDKVVGVIVIGGPAPDKGHEFTFSSKIDTAVRIIIHNNSIQSDCQQILTDHFQHGKFPGTSRGIRSDLDPAVLHFRYLFDQLFRALRVVLKPSLILLTVTDQAFGINTVHQSSVPVIELIQDLLPVNGHLDRFSHPDIFERAVSHIEHEENDIHAAPGDQTVFPFRGLVNLFQRFRIDKFTIQDIEPFLPEHLIHNGWIQDQELSFFNCDRLIVPVIRVHFKNDPVVRKFCHHVRAGAHCMFRIRSIGVSGPAHKFLTEDAAGRSRELINIAGEGPGQGDREMVVIQDPDSFQRICLLGHHFCRSFYRIRKIPLKAVRKREHPGECKSHIGRLYGASVPEKGVVPESEAVGQAVFRKGKLSGQAWDQFRSPVVVDFDIKETFIDIERHHVAAGHPVHIHGFDGL